MSPLFLKSPYVSGAGRDLAVLEYPGALDICWLIVRNTLLSNGYTSGRACLKSNIRTYYWIATAYSVHTFGAQNINLQNVSLHLEKDQIFQIHDIRKHKESCPLLISLFLWCMWYKYFGKCSKQGHSTLRILLCPVFVVHSLVSSNNMETSSISRAERIMQ